MPQAKLIVNVMLKNVHNCIHKEPHGTSMAMSVLTRFKIYFNHHYATPDCIVEYRIEPLL